MGHDDSYYHSMASALDRMPALDDPRGRATMPAGQRWQRYRPEEQPVYIRDAWGNARTITTTQARILDATRGREDQTIRATVLANSLGVAVSTVTRALVKLAAFGLVAYDTARGRNGGITFMATSWADLKGRAKGAWSKIRHERQKATGRYMRKLDKSLYWWSGLDVTVNLASPTT